MNIGLNIPQTGALDLVSLGALNHRVDSGIIPFRKAIFQAQSLPLDIAKVAQYLQEPLYRAGITGAVGLHECTRSASPFCRTFG